MYDYLEDINVIRTCYDFFKNIPDMDSFGKISIPQTEYQTNLKEMYKPPVEMWLEDFTRRHYNEVVVEQMGMDTFRDFEEWRRKNNVAFDTSPIKLGIALSNLRIEGAITKGRESYKGRYKNFNISKLKEYFNLGLLIDINEEEIETNNDNESEEEVELIEE